MLRETVKKAVRRMGFDTEQSNLRSGFIACTAMPTASLRRSHEAHALALMEHLDSVFNSIGPSTSISPDARFLRAALHGDIGLLGVKTKVGGESMEGYHVFVGGGFGKYQAVAGRSSPGGLRRSQADLEKCSGYLRIAREVKTSRPHRAPRTQCAASDLQQ